MSEFEPVQPAMAVEYDHSRPALLFASDQRRRARAEGALAASGFRLAGSLALEEAATRLADQGSLGLAWLELGEEDATPLLDQLLVQLNDLAESRRTAVVACAPIELVDTIAARLTHQLTEILIDPDDAQRAATLALAAAAAADPEDRRVQDVGSDNAARLRQLSDEMGRIAATLARLSTGPGAPAVKPSEGDAPDVDVESLRAIIRARRLRLRFFSEELFADPAWDMLLDLLQAEIAQLRVPVSSLCIAASVPATTALRWIKTMTEQGLFVRRADPHDGRRVFVELAPVASAAMRRYFAEVGKLGVV